MKPKRETNIYTSLGPRLYSRSQPQESDHDHLKSISKQFLNPNNLLSSTTLLHNTNSTNSPVDCTHTSSPMTDSTHTINARDLSSRLSRLAQNNDNSKNNNNAATNHGSSIDTHTTPGGFRRINRATSFDSLPRFTKSSTMSSTSTGSTRFSGLHGRPSRALQRRDVEVSPGEFSMPRVPKRSRRSTGASSDSHERRRKEKNSFEAHAYGRHSNQWLFNDFSFTDAVRRGCGKVFGREH